MKQKTQQVLFEELPLIERIGHILVEYDIPRKDKFPYNDWVDLIAWECHVTIEDVQKEIKKLYL